MGVKRAKQCMECGRAMKFPKKYMKKVSCIHCLKVNDVTRKDYLQNPDQITESW